MATALPNNNINIPYSSFLNETTGRPNQEWLLWLMNPSFITLNIGNALGVTSGGTGLTAIPTNGQLLIGNGTGYTLNTLATGSGISVANGVGTITVSNTGVLSNIAGSGISVSGATGNVTIANTGVLSFSGGTTGLTPATPTTGAVVLSGTLNLVNGGSGATTASGARTNFGATTLGSNLFTITNPSAITFPRFNANNTVSSLNAADFRTAIGAGTGGGSVTSVGTTGSVNGITLTGTVTTAGTLTLGGALSGVDLTTQVSGILPVGNGGSGANSLIGYVYGNGASPFSASTTIPSAAITGLGTMSTQNIGVSGSFITANIPAKTVTVTNGIITSIV